MNINLNMTAKTVAKTMIPVMPAVILIFSVIFIFQFL